MTKLAGAVFGGCAEGSRVIASAHPFWKITTNSDPAKLHSLYGVNDTQLKEMQHFALTGQLPKNYRGSREDLIREVDSKFK